MREELGWKKQAVQENSLLAQANAQESIRKSYKNKQIVKSKAKHIIPKEKPQPSRKKSYCGNLKNLQPMLNEDTLMNSNNNTNNSLNIRGNSSSSIGGSGVSIGDNGLLYLDKPDNLDIHKQPTQDMEIISPMLDNNANTINNNTNNANSQCGIRSDIGKVDVNEHEHDIDDDRYREVDVVLQYIPRGDRELIPNMKTLFTPHGDLDLCDLVKNLKEKGFPIEKTMISYYNYNFDLFVYCGAEPLPDHIIIPYRDIKQDAGGRLHVMLRLKQPNSALMEAEDESGTNDLEGKIKVEASYQNTHDLPTKQKRTKERKIGDILNKICLWRKLYNGYTDPNTGETIKMSLEDAAHKVGISKKSLDDYLLQIRFGKKYGFNFNEHANDKVGILRAFVRKYKTNQVQDKHKEKENDESATKLISPEFARIIDKKKSHRKAQAYSTKKHHTHPHSHIHPHHHAPPPPPPENSNNQASNISSRTRRIFK